LALVQVYALIFYLREERRVWIPDERESWFDNGEGRKEKFGNIFEAASLDLTVVVPAFNEERRIVKMLDETVKYLKDRRGFSWEIIVVDDGSKDKTVQIVQVRKRVVNVCFSLLVF
jgi:cellulose synthase/poly-beta-1,6-N-acetylglucosamine synthase-like glycosyltransferase